MEKQRNSVKGVQLWGRRIVAKVSLSIVLALLAVTALAGMTTGQAHAATRSHTYTIKYGDTLSGLAREFGTTVDALASANGIANPNIIYAGQTIIIPDGHNHNNKNNGGSTSGTPQRLSGSYADMIRQVFGPYGEGAVHVAMCESGLNPNAYNGVLGAAGLFQIIPGTFASTSYAGQNVYNPVVNIKAAHEIFVRDGYSWREWACKP